MNNKIKIAICYDFDGTLCSGSMQEYNFMQQFGIKPEDFWARVVKMSKEHNADYNLCWMKLMLDEAKAHGMEIHKSDFGKFACNIKLYSGVEQWVHNINIYAKTACMGGVELQHFILSSGLKEMVEALPMSRQFKKIYACSYMYNDNDVAIWPSSVINYTNKTQFLFRISKGCLDETDLSVNDKYSQIDIPMRNILYIGDGFTDVPCMVTLRKLGGHAIAVYDPLKDGSQTTAQKLLSDNRVDFVSQADYRPGFPLYRYVRALIHKILADNALANI